MADRTLTDKQAHLLVWLGMEDFSQYGECYGPDLDALVSLGLAQLHPSGEHQSRFIAKGQSKMYWAVSLTEYGVQLLHQQYEDKLTEEMNRRFPPLKDYD